MKTRGEQTAAEALETNKGSIIYHALHSGNLTVDVERWVAEYGGGGNGGSKTGPKRGPSANAGHGGGGGGKLYGGLAGFEAGEWALRHLKPYNRARNSVAQYGNSVIKEGAVHFARNAIGQMARAAQTVEEGLTQTWQNVRTGLNLFGRQAAQTMRQAGPAAAAVLAGGAAALKTSALAAGQAILTSTAAAGSAAVAGGAALGAGIYLSGLGNLLGTTQLGEYIVDDWMKTFN